MNNINVTVELCAEDRARIDKLTSVLEARINQVSYCLDHDLLTNEEAPDFLQRLVSLVNGYSVTNENRYTLLNLVFTNAFLVYFYFHNANML